MVLLPKAQKGFYDRIGALVIMAIVCVAVVITSGCGDGRPARVPISGQVLIDGKPVTQGSIAIIPENARASSSEIGPDGRFTMSCFDDKDGVVPGTHVVTVISFEVIDSQSRKWLVPPKYSDPETSDAKITIGEADDSLTINLSWDGGKPFVERFVSGE